MATSSIYRRFLPYLGRPLHTRSRRYEMNPHNGLQIGIHGDRYQYDIPISQRYCPLRRTMTQLEIKSTRSYSVLHSVNRLLYQQTPHTVTQISESFIKPEKISKESKQPIPLCPWELAMLSVHYSQKGILFNKQTDNENSADALVSKLKSSLSTTLTHFYPLSGQLSTIKKQNPDSLFIFIDPGKGSGVRFIHAKANITVSDVVSSKYVPLVVQSFFADFKAVNHDGHFKPLLTVQVTELIDGIFLGWSVNHVLSDGNSFWHFINSWSEVFVSENPEISRKPIHTRWFPDGYGPIINLPFSDENQFIKRYQPPVLTGRIFHFSAESLQRLKSRANTEYYSDKTEQLNKLSSFQALASLIWRCIARSRFSPVDEITICSLSIDNRVRLNPKLSENYFGNYIQRVRGAATCGELLEENLGWAAMKLHEAIANHTDKTVRDLVDEWFKSPSFFQMGQDPFIVHMGNSPRFEMYSEKFGLGKPLCVRSGNANKYCGKITSYPGVEGGGSVDMEVCLRPEVMSVFEADEELTQYVSVCDTES